MIMEILIQKDLWGVTDSYATTKDEGNHLCRLGWAYFDYDKGKFVSYMEYSIEVRTYFTNKTKSAILP